MAAGSKGKSLPSSTQLPDGAADLATSIVLITRDQAWNVDAAIEVAIAELKTCDGGEVIVVDSASSDGTLERAARHPVGLVELGDDQVLTPALGRWLGGRLARGEAVLFLDGDMQLVPGWLGCARRVLNDADDVGCVSGAVLYGDEPHQPSQGEPAHRDIPWFGGAALIRRAALERAGTFNPVLRSEEESELSTRIRAAGYRIVLLDRPIAAHPASDRNPVREVLLRRRRGLYLGFGQVLKLHARASSRSEYLQGRAFWIPPALAVAGAALAVAAARRSRSALPLAGAGSLAALVGALQIKRKGGLAPAVFGLMSRVAILEGTVRGITLPATSPSAFAPSFRVHRHPPHIAARA